MILTEHPPPPGEDVFVELASLLVVAQHAQVEGEIVGRDQGVRVVLTQYPTVAGEDVLIELAGLLVLAHRGQI